MANKNVSFLKSNWIWIVAVIFAAFILYNMFRKDTWYNKYKCETKEIALKGVVTNVSGRSGFTKVQVDNVAKPIPLNVQDEISRKGFDKYHFFGPGDSIIKAANSKEVTVKNKDSMVVFTISCDD